MSVGFRLAVTLVTGVRGSGSCRGDGFRAADIGFCDEFVFGTGRTGRGCALITRPAPRFIIT